MVRSAVREETLKGIDFRAGFEEQGRPSIQDDRDLRAGTILKQAAASYFAFGHCYHERIHYYG